MIAEKTKINLDPIINSLEGWCDLEKANRLYNLILESDSKVTCELGAFGARSLIPMALAHKEKGSGFAFGIDTWNKNACLREGNSPLNNEWWAIVDFEKIYNSAARAIDKLELNDYCGLMKLKSQTMALIIADNVVDVIHQDSSHDSETIVEELKLWIPKLKIGGYWIADDTNWQESLEGYSHLHEFGLENVEAFETWEIWKKVK